MEKTLTVIRDEKSRMNDGGKNGKGNGDYNKR